MTKEEALKILDTIPTISEQVDALEMAIKALETQPCEDCISRQAVIDIVEDMHDLARSDVLSEAVKRLSELPSVTPQPKIGRWIRWYEVIESADGKSTDHIPHCKCSECGTKYDPHSSQFIKYCHNCGARMAESEEEE